MITACIVARTLDKRIARALKSVIEQKEPPGEILIVIDGIKREDSNELSLILPVPPRDITVRHIWSENRKSPIAGLKNIGLYHATGDWISFIDSDDFILPSYFASSASMLSNTDAELIVEFPGVQFVSTLLSPVKRVLPTKDGWGRNVASFCREMMTSAWKRPDYKIRLGYIRTRAKKYFSMDYDMLADKVLFLNYIIEERKVLLSDVCGYVTTKSLDIYHSMSKDLPEYTRCEKIAKNTHISQWMLKGDILDVWKSQTFLTEDDVRYVENL